MKFFTIEKHYKNTLTKISKPFLLLTLFTQLYFISSAQPPVRPKLAIQLLLNTNPGPENTADGVVAFFDDNFSFSIGGEDSYKWTNLDENLAIVRNEKLLSIEGRPLIHYNDTMRLKMWTFRQKNYYLKFAASSFASTVTAVVRDNYLNKETAVDLSSSTLVPFSLTPDSASFAANRFSVVFKTAKVFTLSGAMKFSSVFREDASIIVAPNPVSGNVISVQFSNLKQGNYEVSLYSSEGQLVYAGFLSYDGSSSTQTITLDRRLHIGIYSLLIASGERTITKNVLFE
jgi:hypothetical protein